MILPSIKWYFSFSCILFQLIESTSTECICANQAGLPSFSLIPVGQLGHCCGFACTLQTWLSESVNARPLRKKKTTNVPTNMITLDFPFTGLNGSLPGSRRAHNSSNTAFNFGECNDNKQCFRQQKYLLNKATFVQTSSHFFQIDLL